MARFKRAQAVRRLQDNYAKLPPEKQRAMGYGTITKAAGANEAPAPQPQPKPMPMTPRSKASSDDAKRIQERLEMEEAQGVKRGRAKGLAGLRQDIGHY